MTARIGKAFLLSVYLLLPFALGGDVICKMLPPEICAFAISGSGRRCVVESYRPEGSATRVYTCQESEVVVERWVDWVETEECVAACGADRRMVGISSDALFDRRFTEKLCSSECFYNCPNLIDLYGNLAAGEGVELSRLCEIRRSNPARAMAERSSSGNAAMTPAPTESATTASDDGEVYSEAPIAGAPAPAVAVPAASSIADDSDAFIPAATKDDAAAGGDVVGISTDTSTDELDADPAPIPAMSPSDFLDFDEDEDADFI